MAFSEFIFRRGFVLGGFEFFFFGGHCFMFRFLGFSDLRRYFF